MLKKLVVPFALNCAFIVFVVFLAGGGVGGLTYLVDVPSLIIALVAPFLAALATHGPARAFRSFSCPFEPDCASDELAKSRAFLLCFLRYLAAFTAFAVVTGTIMLLGYLAEDNLAMIGRNLAVALLAIFYGSVGAILFILPFLSEIDRRLAA